MHGASDNDERSFATEIPGDDKDPVMQDCGRSQRLCFRGSITQHSDLPADCRGTTMCPPGGTVHQRHSVIQ